MRESLEMTSATFALRDGVTNIEAKTPSVTLRGRPRVTEMGLWSEKKEERARTRLAEICSQRRFTIDDDERHHQTYNH